jgi:hypothetical protein
MNNELERFWKKVVVAEFEAYPGICMEGRREVVIRNLSQNRQFINQDLSLGSLGI